MNIKSKHPEVKISLTHAEAKWLRDFLNEHNSGEGDAGLDWKLWAGLGKALGED